MLNLVEFGYAFQVFALAALLLWFMEDGHLLAKWGKFLRTVNFENPELVWLWKPLGLCGRCFSGQVGLWSGFMIMGAHPIKALFFAAIVVLLNEIKDATLNRG